MAYIFKLKNKTYEQTLNALTDPNIPGCDFSAALQKACENCDANCDVVNFIVQHGNYVTSSLSNKVYAHETLISGDQIERVKVLDLSRWTEIKEEDFEHIPDNTEIVVECSKPTESWNRSPKWVFCATVSKWPVIELRIYNSNSIICQDLHSLFTNFGRIVVKYFKDL